jgi:hypothetical protein
MREGEIGDRMFVILKGSANITKLLEDVDDKSNIQEKLITTIS